VLTDLANSKSEITLTMSVNYERKGLANQLFKNLKGHLLT